MQEYVALVPCGNWIRGRTVSCIHDMFCRHRRVFVSYSFQYLGQGTCHTSHYQHSVESYSHREATCFP